MRLIDPDHLFFRPRWRRWATVLVPGAWALVECWGGHLLWGTVFAAASAYAARVLVVPAASRGDG